MATTTFDVLGIPQPQGSKTQMPNGAMLEGGRAHLRANRADWRSAVAAAALDARAEVGMFDGPLHLEVAFRFPMPASRSKAWRIIGRGWHSTKPDLDKLVRSVGDSLTHGALIKDDARIVSLTATKIEVLDDWTGATITVANVGHLDPERAA
jgi:crossover junction endodeoxyribonuclease RusA